ncbi:AGE family epimerase/isomerase [Thioclava sp. FR2]|uniref:AGE family epimerase/isomerase n=1 Tax=Thioclava sp. FR2 TaxID=3445780 RepID=UPI003EBAED75
MRQPLASDDLSPDSFWLDDPTHRAWLAMDTRRQFDFFRTSLAADGGFHVLGYDGVPLESRVQELHTTTRLVHSYALGRAAGEVNCEAMIDQGMAYLWSHHRDNAHGGYLWALDGSQIHDERKLAYGHVFVLLAGSSARMAGHPEADRLIDDVSEILDKHYWEDDHGLFADEWNRDWTPFSTYRGMNANMHGVEALLAAFEATGRDRYLNRAGRILNFFLRRMAPAHGFRLPEHYTKDWQVDPGYSGNPMFRPAGTTPGHSFELGRLMLQHWDLSGRPVNDAPAIARRVIETALTDAWDQQRGGLVYTLDFSGKHAIPSRYWWPVTEAIGALASLIKLERKSKDELWYRKLWDFADQYFVDHRHGGWFPEIDDEGEPARTQFMGKPDIYHSVQATLFPLTPGLSRAMDELGSSFAKSGT